MVRSGLKEMMIQGLKNFHSITRHKPYAIVFFRPGSNENEIAKVAGVELTMIREACTKLEADYR